MKRVERRGTLESQQLQNASTLQQHFPRTPQHVSSSSQGADRSIQRSDTLLASQSSLGPSSFTQRSEREEVSHQQFGHRTSIGNPSSNTSGKGVSRQPPTPPAITALREQDDDDDNEDADQLPISNIGRGGRRVLRTSTAHSRSSSRNGRGNGNGSLGATKKSALSNTGRPSVSPRGGDMDIEEMDADADADADVDAEAEILGAADAPRTLETETGNAEGDVDADAEAELFEAVDAAEAISSSSHGGDRSWMKTDV